MFRKVKSARRANQNPLGTSLGSCEGLESRVMLTASLDGLYVGTFSGSVSTPFGGVTIPSEDFPNNQVLSEIHGTAVEVLLPGSSSGTLSGPSNSLSFSTQTFFGGIPLDVSYQGSYTAGANGKVSGTGTWSIGTNAFGATGGGTWSTERMSDTPGVRSGAAFRLDANNNGKWDAPPGVTKDAAFNIGNSTDIPVSGVWTDGSIFDNTGVFRNGKWYLDTGNQVYEGPGNGDIYAQFGSTGDKPVVGDWNGDLVDDIGVFRNGKLYLDANGNHQWDGAEAGDIFATFGAAGDTPVSGDWNGDGKDEIGVFRNVGNTGRFYLDLNGNYAWNSATDATFVFGNSNDKPVIGDWNTDGVDDVGVVRAASWYLDMNGNRQWNNTTGGDVILKFGSATDTPLAGIWRPLDIPNPPFMTGAAPQPKSISSESASPPTAVQSVTANQLSAPKAKKLDEYFSSIGTGTVAV